MKGLINKKCINFYGTLTRKNQRNLLYYLCDTDQFGTNLNHYFRISIVNIQSINRYSIQSDQIHWNQFKGRSAQFCTALHWKQ